MIRVINNGDDNRSYSLRYPMTIHWDEVREEKIANMICSIIGANIGSIESGIGLSVEEWNLLKSIFDTMELEWCYE